VWILLKMHTSNDTSDLYRPITQIQQGLNLRLKTYGGVEM
jgi:hypothetical protein